MLLSENLSKQYDRYSQNAHDTCNVIRAYKVSKDPNSISRNLIYYSKRDVNRENTSYDLSLKFKKKDLSLLCIISIGVQIH